MVLAVGIGSTSSACIDHAGISCLRPIRDAATRTVDPSHHVWSLGELVSIAVLPACSRGITLGSPLPIYASGGTLFPFILLSLMSVLPCDRSMAGLYRS